MVYLGILIPLVEHSKNDLPVRLSGDPAVGSCSGLLRGLCKMLNRATCRIQDFSEADRRVKDAVCFKKDADERRLEALIYGKTCGQ